MVSITLVQSIINKWTLFLLARKINLGSCCLSETQIRTDNMKNTTSIKTTTQ